MSFIHVSFQGIKGPARRITHKLYNLSDEENNIVDAETWDTLLQSGSTIKPKYREPQTQQFSETITNSTSQETNPKERVDFNVYPQRRLRKHKKSVHRRKVKEKASRAAKIAESKKKTEYPFFDKESPVREVRGRTLFKNRTKRRRP